MFSAANWWGLCWGKAEGRPQRVFEHNSARCHLCKQNADAGGTRDGIRQGQSVDPQALRSQPPPKCEPSCITDEGRRAQ